MGEEVGEVPPEALMSLSPLTSEDDAKVAAVGEVLPEEEIPEGRTTASPTVTEEVTSSPQFQKTMNLLSKRKTFARQTSDLKLGGILKKSTVANEVKLPEGEALGKWLEVHVFIFTDVCETLQAAFTNPEKGPICSEETCPKMTAGTGHYMWADGVVVKEPVDMPAPTYISTLLTWIRTQSTDPAVFPTAAAEAPGATAALVKEVSKDFKKHAAVILKRLFRVFAHYYLQHADKLNAECVGEEAEFLLSKTFKKFVYFVHEFGLVDSKEMSPMKSMIETMLGDKDKA